MDAMNTPMDKCEMERYNHTKVPWPIEPIPLTQDDYSRTYGYMMEAIAMGLAVPRCILTGESIQNRVKK